MQVLRLLRQVFFVDPYKRAKFVLCQLYFYSDKYTLSKGSINIIKSLLNIATTDV